MVSKSSKALATHSRIQAIANRRYYKTKILFDITQEKTLKTFQIVAQKNYSLKPKYQPILNHTKKIEKYTFCFEVGRKFPYSSLKHQTNLHK